jgi:hypothetical protein
MQPGNIASAATPHEIAADPQEPVEVSVAGGRGVGSSSGTADGRPIRPTEGLPGIRDEEMLPVGAFLPVAVVDSVGLWGSDPLHTGTTSPAGSSQCRRSRHVYQRLAASPGVGDRRRSN